MAWLARQAAARRRARAAAAAAAAASAPAAASALTGIRPAGRPRNCRLTAACNQPWLLLFVRDANEPRHQHALDINIIGSLAAQRSGGAVWLVAHFTTRGSSSRLTAILHDGCIIMGTGKGLEERASSAGLAEGSDALEAGAQASPDDKVALDKRAEHVGDGAWLRAARAVSQTLHVEPLGHALLFNGLWVACWACEKRPAVRRHPHRQGGRGCTLCTLAASAARKVRRYPLSSQSRHRAPGHLVARYFHVPAHLPGAAIR